MPICTLNNHVDVLVDGGAEHLPLLLCIKRTKISAATGQN